MKLLCLLLFFFFSSRRRHTRSLCDWSSDVCSSDLENSAYSSTYNSSNMPYLTSLANQYGLATKYWADTHPSIGNYEVFTRSEERRVGKECRSRWSPEQ